MGSRRSLSRWRTILFGAHSTTSRVRLSMGGEVGGVFEVGLEAFLRSDGRDQLFGDTDVVDFAVRETR